MQKHFWNLAEILIVKKHAVSAFQNDCIIYYLQFMRCVSQRQWHKILHVNGTE